MEELVVKKKAWNAGWLKMTTSQKWCLVFGSIMSFMGTGLAMFHPDLHVQVLGSMCLTTGFYYINMSTRSDMK